MSKLERLMNLTVALLETRRPLTAAELHDRVPGYPEDRGAFRRAFERDKDSLREMGVPVALMPIQGSEPPIDGYRIRKDEYYLADPGLDADELAALHLAAGAVQLEGARSTEALWKLGGRIAADGALVDARGEVAALPTGPNLVALFTGVIEARSATFTYRLAERSVDPYRLDFQRGRWYLTGYDHLRDEERNYRVDRIDGEVALGEPGGFTRPGNDVPGLRLAPWQLGEGEPQVARLLVDADQAPSAIHQVGPSSVVEERPDGSVVLQLEVTNPAGFRAFVLTFLDHAEVLGPPALRGELVAWLDALAG